MKINKKITIRNSNPKYPPHPEQRIAMLKEWGETILRVYGGVFSKTFAEAETFIPALQEEEHKLDEKYDYVVVLEDFELVDLINIYGPLQIGLDNGSLLAFTQELYNYPEKSVKRSIKNLYKKIKQKLQKKARAKTLKSKG